MNSADTADQMMKMTLEGIQVAAEIAMKAGGATARSLAATLYAILTDRKKIKGRTRLDSMLKSGKELKVFAIRHSDLKKFCQEAKHYGVLYSVLKEKNNTDGIVDIMVRSEDASKISRIVDKFDLATIDTKAIRESVMAQKKQLPDVKPLSDQEHDDLIQKMMNTQCSFLRMAFISPMRLRFFSLRLRARVESASITLKSPAFSIQSASKWFTC